MRREVRLGIVANIKRDARTVRKFDREFGLVDAAAGDGASEPPKIIPR